MRDKVDPYLRPVYDAPNDFMDGRIVEGQVGLQTGMIESRRSPSCEVRRSPNAAILLDEAQNATACK